MNHIQNEEPAPSGNKRLRLVLKSILAISLNVAMWLLVLVLLPFLLSFGLDKSIQFSQSSIVATFIVNLSPILLIASGYLMLSRTDRDKLARRLSFTGLLFATPVAISGGTPSLFLSYLIHLIRWHRYFNAGKFMTVLTMICAGGALTYFIIKYSFKLFLHIKKKLWAPWLYLNTAFATLVVFVAYQMILMGIYKLLRDIGFQRL